MSQAKRALGAEGEARAANYLRRRGYRIAARNLRLAGVELDLVLLRGGTAVFVEVKTRRTAACGTPFEAITPRQQARILHAAAAWLRANPGRARRVRFDAVACLVDASGRWRIQHVEAAFEASTAGIE